MDGTAIIASPPTSNPLSTLSTNTKSSPKEDDELDGFVLRLDEADSNSEEDNIVDVKEDGKLSSGGMLGDQSAPSEELSPKQNVDSHKLDIDESSQTVEPADSTPVDDSTPIKNGIAEPSNCSEDAKSQENEESVSSLSTESPNLSKDAKSQKEESISRTEDHKDEKIIPKDDNDCTQKTEPACTDEESLASSLNNSTPDKDSKVENFEAVAEELDLLLNDEGSEPLTTSNVEPIGRSTDNKEDQTIPKHDQSVLKEDNFETVADELDLLLNTGRESEKISIKSDKDATTEITNDLAVNEIAIDDIKSTEIKEGNEIAIDDIKSTEIKEGKSGENILTQNTENERYGEITITSPKREDEIELKTGQSNFVKNEADTGATEDIGSPSGDCEMVKETMVSPQCDTEVIVECLDDATEVPENRTADDGTEDSESMDSACSSSTTDSNSEVKHDISNEMPNQKKRAAEMGLGESKKKAKFSSNVFNASECNGINTDDDTLLNGYHEASGQNSDSDVSSQKKEEIEPKRKRPRTESSPVTEGNFPLSCTYSEARAKIVEAVFKNSNTIQCDMNILEEVIMMKVAEYFTVGMQHNKKLDTAAVQRKCAMLEEKLQQVHKKAHELKKQVEDCKHIIKKLIEEKVSGEPWTNHVMPLRVTRSVGLQVNTTSRQRDMESVKQMLRESRDKDDSQDKDDLIFVGETTKDASQPSKNISPNIERRASGPDRVSCNERNTFPKSKTPPKILDSSAPKKMPATVAACIDLTDNDDTPTKTTDTTSPKTATPGGVSVKPASALFPVEKTNGVAKSPAPAGSVVSSSKLAKKSTGGGVGVNSRPSATLFAAEKMNGISKSPSPAESGAPSSKLAKKSTGGGNIKKPTISQAAADLVSSYEHLPKFPLTPKYPPEISRPPRPTLKIGKNTSGKQGIMLSWNFEAHCKTQDITDYQLYAYQESKNSADKPKETMWKKVGDIKALPLPMACFLTQFVEGHKYHFIVRAVNTEKRLGEFSLPGSIILQSASNLPATASQSPAASSAGA